MSAELKLLDAYTKADKDAFFGRDQEVEALYRLFFRAQVLVVYGGSGSGKTSLLQCGLANRLPDTDWTPVFIRRRRDLNVSLIEALTGRPARGKVTSAAVLKAVESLYLTYLRPLCLVLDQFEELYVLGDVAEQRQFGLILKALLRAKAHCRIVISLREDYLARLDDLEKLVPDLLGYRLRVEPMSRQNLKAVIVGTARVLDLRLEHGGATADRIIENLEDSRGGVQLAYLQVYLDRLRAEALGAQKSGRHPVITDAIVQATGRLGDVLAAFLDRQTLLIQAEVASAHPAAPADAVRQVLEALATLEGTKVPRTEPELIGLLPGLEPGLIEVILQKLQASRLVNRFQGEYELAHDALAQRVADSRGAQAKYRMQLMKMVSDTRQLFESAGDDPAARAHRSYLTGHQLALLRPYLPTLQLDPQDADFVRRSGRDASMARLRQAGAFAAVAGVVAVVAIFGAIVDEPGAAAPVGELLTNLGQPGIARWVLTPARALHPEETALMLQRGDTYLRSAEESDGARRADLKRRAEADFEEADSAVAAGGDTGLLNQLCWFRTVHAGDLQAALRDCNLALKGGDVFDSRALVELKLGNYAAARDDYTTALAVSRTATAHYGKAVALRALGRPEAEAEMRLALQADPNVARVFRDDYWYPKPP